MKTAMKSAYFLIGFSPASNYLQYMRPDRPHFLITQRRQFLFGNSSTVQDISKGTQYAIQDPLLRFCEKRNVPSGIEPYTVRPKEHESLEKSDDLRSHKKRVALGVFLLCFCFGSCGARLSLIVRSFV